MGLKLLGPLRIFESFEPSCEREVVTDCAVKRVVSSLYRMA
jgi:hypothetical protein